jgi:hypothetical protein
LQVVIASQYAGQHPGLAQYLETVANANDQPTLGGKPLYGGHYRGEPGNGPGAQVIPIGEPARQHNTLVLSQVILFMPNVVGLLP